MKILVVNNHNRDIPRNFHAIFERNDVEYDIQSYLDLDKQSAMNYDGIILTGTDLPPHVHPSLFENEINLIQTTKLPVLGICGGFLIINMAFGGNIKKISDARYGKRKMLISVDDEIFSPARDQMELFVKHQFSIDKMSDEWIILGRSEDHELIYAMKHRQKPIYGFQPHPERRNDGDIIMDNFFQIVRETQLIVKEKIEV